MKEYIERESLQKAMEFVTNDSTCPLHIAAEIDQYIAQEPAADVVKVVRCKNCLYAEKCGDKYECMHDHGLVELLDGNDFCSYGEVKE